MARRSEGWTLRRDPRTGKWIVRFRVAGRRTNRSTGTTDRGEALQRAGAIYEAAVTGRSSAPASPTSLIGVSTIDVCALWLAAMEDEGNHRPKTLQTWERIYVKTHFAAHFRDAAELASPARLAAYVSWRLRSARAETVAKECSALRSLLGYLARPDVALLAEAPPVPQPKKGTGKAALTKVRVDLTPEQVEAILAALPETIRAKRRGESRRPCRAFFRVLWETGLRAAGLWRLEAPGDYRVGAEELVIRDEADKAAFGRTLPLTDAARAALDSVCPASGLVFGEEKNFRTQLKRAALAAGIPEHLAGHVSPHDFRHARTTDLLDAGAPLTGVAYLMGHKQITTTNRYVHPGAKAARAALSGHRSGHGARETAESAGDGKAKAPGIPGAFVVGHEGLEPSANGLRVHCSTN